MQFKNIFLAASAFAGALAVQFTNSNFDLTAGQPFTLTWSGADGPVTIFLKDGASTDLKTVSTVGSGLTGNSIVFVPSASLSTDFYAFEIQDSTAIPNYSQQFLVSGATGAPSSSASSAAASSTATSTVTAVSTSSGLSSSAASSSSAGSSSAASSTTATDSSTTATDSSTTATDSSSAASTTTTGSSSSSSTASASKSDSTTLSTTHSKTSASNTASSTTSPATSAPTSSAAGLSSPLAFVFLALAAIVMLN
ncbi:extracellular matrix protein [Rutstroemia sp. NJR-2017a WRK4]|nr:extracellular matrix protein [Rutstroemia sp. NJR-2017a WRK4]